MGNLLIMKTLININGKFYQEKDAKISVFDRGFLYGDSIYEVTHTVNFVPIKLTEHLERLYSSARKMGMTFWFSKDFIIEELYKTLDSFGISECYIRIIITRGEGEIGLSPDLATKNNFIIIIKELPQNPSWWYEKGVHMIVAETKRNPIESLDPSIKSGNYLNNVLAIAEAKKQNAFDAIMLNHEGFISEGTTSNIWLVTKSGEIWTPPLKAGILEGITRKTLLKLLKDEMPDKIHEKNFKTEDLLQASEAFLTSSTKHVVPITQVNKTLVGNGQPGEISQKLLAMYQEEIKKEVQAGIWRK